MQSLVASSVAGIVVQIIGAVLALLISEGIRHTIRKRQARAGAAEEPAAEAAGPARYYIGWSVTGIVAVLTFILVGLVYNAVMPGPAVAVNSPDNGAAIAVWLAEEGSGGFTVKGDSKRVTMDPNLRVCVLVHPVDPFAEGWWIQPAVVMNSDGAWSGQAWIGDPENPPHVGDVVDIMAVAALPDRLRGHAKVADPMDLGPAAQSELVEVRIGRLLKAGE
ncbi:MAG: hypothetical protein SWH68_11910 [Thermodesulfobacteriota bacterium]|nr:hypothetical protein [Thermodesulfobacteriota bacterium]